MRKKLTINKTTFFFCTYIGTIGGTVAAKEMKEYIRNTYRSCIIDSNDLNDLKEDLLREKKRVLENNPRAKDIPLVMYGLKTGANAYLAVNGETVMTLLKCRGIVKFERP